MLKYVCLILDVKYEQTRARNGCMQRSREHTLMGYAREEEESN